MPLHSAHPTNTSEGMVFILLKTHHLHSSNKINYATQVDKLLNDLLERGHYDTKVLDMFKEAEMKLIEINKERNSRKNITYRSSLEETLEIFKRNKKSKNNNDMNGKILLHPTCHPKDVSRNKLQGMFNTTCKSKFQDLLK